MLKSEDIKPTITGLEFYVTAFKELSSCRPVTMSAGAIPFTAILEYFKVYPVGDFDEFLWIIRLMDSEYLRLEELRQNKKEPKPNVSNTNQNDKSNSGRKRK